MTWAVGGKGANLGELTQAGLPVPPGFVITADAYLDAARAAPAHGVAWRAAGASPACRPGRASTGCAGEAAGPGARAGRCPPSCARRSSRPTTASATGRGSPCARRATGEDAGRHLVRRHERDLHQRRRRRRAARARSSTAGPRCTARASSPTGPASDLTTSRRIAVVVQRMVASRALGRHVHRRPLDRRPRSHRHRGRVRPGRGRGQRPGRARHLRRRQGGPAARRTCGSAPRRFKIVRGPDGADRAGRARTEERRAARAHRRRGRSTLARLGAAPSRSTTARPRTSSGRWPADAPYLVQSRRSRPSARPPTPTTGTGAVRRSSSGLAASPGRAIGRGARAPLARRRATSCSAGEVLVAPMTNPTGCRPCAGPRRWSPTAAG